MKLEVVAFHFNHDKLSVGRGLALLNPSENYVEDEDIEKAILKIDRQFKNAAYYGNENE